MRATTRLCVANYNTTLSSDSLESGTGSSNSLRSAKESLRTDPQRFAASCTGGWIHMTEIPGYSSAARDDAVGGLLSCQILGMRMPSPDDMRARTGRPGRGTQRHQRRAGVGAISGVPTISFKSPWSSPKPLFDGRPPSGSRAKTGEPRG
jgi:hypothetical protein